MILGGILSILMMSAIPDTIRVEPLPIVLPLMISACLFYLYGGVKLQNKIRQGKELKYPFTNKPIKPMSYAPRVTSKNIVRGLKFYIKFYKISGFVFGGFFLLSGSVAIYASILQKFSLNGILLTAPILFLPFFSISLVYFAYGAQWWKRPSGYNTKTIGKRR